MTDEEMQAEWVRQNRVICRCKKIRLKTFEAAIKRGATSVSKVNRAVGSGSGDCKGKRCGPKVEELLREHR